MNSSVTIVGAGIGGLTTALILKNRGIHAQIFEGSKELKPVGGGIILANNAMQVFQKLGLQEKIEAAGNKISCMKITNPQLKPISKINLGSFEKKYGVHNIAIHRGSLQTVLLNELGTENLHLNKRLATITKQEVFKLNFQDHSFAESNIVIGADGIKSVVRNQLFAASTIRNAQQICWRAICNFTLPNEYNHEVNEAWGVGKRFGFVKISESKIYWYALANSKNTTSAATQLPELFSDFHSHILEIIAATPTNQIITSDITDLQPIPKWQQPQVCLIGDAAHAMTPNLGQGACQAIEDAYTIGQLLDKGFSLENAFEVFQNIRTKKVNTIVNQSWAIGKIAQLENKLGITVRNFILQNIPAFANRKQMSTIFNIR